MPNDAIVSPDPEVLRKFEEGCQKGNHPPDELETILRSGSVFWGWDETKWCKVCDSIKVESRHWAYSGRVNHVDREMRRPAILERR